MTDFRALCAELVDELEDWIAYGDEADCADAHAVVDRARAALSQPEPQGPTDEELIQLAIDTRLYRFQATVGDPVQYEMSEQQVHAFARAVLTRWGRPAITPIPVSERLPGPEDCDTRGRCWWFSPLLGGWKLCDARGMTAFPFWLPRPALPVPQP